MDENKYKGCAECDTLHPIPLKSNNGKEASIFWFGANKGTQDFLIAFSDLTLNYITVLTPDYPILDAIKYDFYCASCAKKYIQKDLEQEKWKSF